MKKRGQQTMGMPIGMIFTIFLIVIFFVVAFIAIGHFLDLGRTSSVGLFYRDLQDAVDDAWGGQSSESSFKINLPSGITTICFADLSSGSSGVTGSFDDYDQIKNYDVYDANTFLLPPENAENMQWKLIEHINVSKITEIRNPYCVDVARDLKIKKGFYDKLVVIE